jgi:hypothetical protein
MTMMKALLVAQQETPATDKPWRVCELVFSGDDRTSFIKALPGEWESHDEAIMELMRLNGVDMTDEELINETTGVTHTKGLQSAEFDALYQLILAYKQLPPVVDDDYPEAREQYEIMLRRFLIACAENGKAA